MYIHIYSDVGRKEAPLFEGSDPVLIVKPLTAISLETTNNNQLF